MVKFSINIEGLDCLCSFSADFSRVTYIIYPMAVLDDWIVTASEKFQTSIVVITGMDWDNDLTPWPAKGVPKGCPDFKGLASEFLKRLEAIVKRIETKARLSMERIERNLVGVSLSGLFTLWQWPQCPLFRNIASLSGSFWYDGFIDWFRLQDFSGKKGMAFFLLGEKESKSTVSAFKPVEANTEAIVSALRRDGIKVTFDIVPGNHYQFPIDRLNRAMSALTKTS